MKKLNQTYAFLFSIAGVIILLDQWTKYLVRTRLEFTQEWAPWPWLLPYARIVHWNNTGAAFGLFQGLNPVFIVLAIIVSSLIIYFFPRVPRSEWMLRLALSMQLGGAIGNLIDRLIYGTVTDFVSVGTFAVFNVADSCITLGVIVLALDLLIKDRQEKTQPKQPATAAQISTSPQEPGAAQEPSDPQEPDSGAPQTP